MRTLIRNVRIFDGSGSAPYAGSVLVDGEHIAQVAQGADALDGAAHDQRIEGEGRTLMPGMVDAHTHLTWGSSIEKIYHQFILPPE